MARKPATRKDPLRTYKAKRDFTRTAEPSGSRVRTRRTALAYLIQKHAARRLHYDFRLEWNGTLMSWAVPKGPSENPDDKRLAVHVEDHPVEYGGFEGTIPEGEYGGGTVMLWDRGTWEPQPGVDVDEAMRKGKLAFVLHGERLKGKWALVRLRPRSAKDRDNWLLIKELDDHVERRRKLITERETESVASGRAMEEIAQGRKVWHSNRAASGAAARGDPEIVAGPGPSPKRKSKTKNKRAPRGVKKNAAALPAFMAPQLATLVDAPPAGDGWLHEIKFDGYRAVTAIAGGKVAIRTRNGLDWTDRFRMLVPALSALPCRDAVLDGEIAVADAQGHTDFGALQDALGTGRGGIAYYLFDLLELDGEDWRKRPLIERKERLKALIGAAKGTTKGATKGPLVYSDHVLGDGGKMYDHACDIRLEGIISKRADAPYRSGRNGSWLKIKCGQEQEFVLIGWRPSRKAGRPFASLLLALNEDGRLRYAGRVGSGYSAPRLSGLARRFRALERDTAPVSGIPRPIARDAHFLEPKLVAEIALRGWTRDGLARQASFKGLREDKPAAAVTRERTMPTEKAARSAAARQARPAKRSAPARAAAGTATGDGAELIEGVRVTHPDRVLFPDQGVTKRELIAHYLSIADRIMPHIAGRPVSLVRCPQGSGKQCFFQKHASDGFPDAFKTVRIHEKSGTRDYLYIDDTRGLIAAVQVGVLELHVWGCRVDAIEKPDRLVFDLDPDAGLDFARVREAARDLRARLKRLGLDSFPLVTGGKGVHVVVPLTRGHSWDAHKDFAEAMARLMEEDAPDRYVANMSKAKRKGRIFVDYLRNQRGATAICPYSTRTKSGAFVAMPVSWPALARLADAHPVEVGEAAAFARGRDPWPGYFTLQQALPKL